MGRDRVFWVAGDCPLHARDLGVEERFTPYHDEGPF